LVGVLRTCARPGSKITNNAMRYYPISLTQTLPSPNTISKKENSHQDLKMREGGGLLQSLIEATETIDFRFPLSAFCIIQAQQ
jgi:hypothetical protein